MEGIEKILMVWGQKSYQNRQDWGILTRFCNLTPKVSKLHSSVEAAAENNKN